MHTDHEIKKLVKDKYSQIAEQNTVANRASCCGAGDSSAEVYNIMTDDYSQVKGYDSEADLGLGCGLPTQFAKIEPGQTVLDLGSGAGNDCFVARYETGAEGKVIGVDFSETMIAKARKNAEKRGFNNVEFRQGDIEDMPVSNASVDVVVSNCVLNLVPNKQAVFREIFRVLKPGAHFSISDIVLEGQLPEQLQADAEMYAGCVSGAIQKADYLEHIQNTGFAEVTLQKQKPIVIPDDILSKYLNRAEMEAFKSGATGIFSITVFAKRPATPDDQPAESATAVTADTACAPESGCC